MKKTEDGFNIVFQDENCTLCRNSSGEYVIRGEADVIIESAKMVIVKCDALTVVNGDGDIRSIGDGNIEYIGRGTLRAFTLGEIIIKGTGKVISRGTGDIYVEGSGQVLLDQDRHIPKKEYEAKIKRDLEDESIPWDCYIYDCFSPEEVAEITARKAYFHDIKNENPRNKIPLIQYPVAVREINGNMEPVIYSCYHINNSEFKAIRVPTV